MFDIGFTELLVIAVVALIVLGPERLPKAARFTGLWVRRARAQWHSVRDELERELAAEELKRNLDAARTAVHDAEQAMQESGRKAQREFGEVRASVTGTDTGTNTLDDAAVDTPADNAENPENKNGARND